MICQSRRSVWSGLNGFGEFWVVFWVAAVGWDRYGVLLAVGLERFGRFWRVLDVIINPVNNVPFLASPPCLLPPFSSSCLFSFSLSPSIRLFFLFLPSSSTGTSLKRARHARKTCQLEVSSVAGSHSHSVVLEVSRVAERPRALRLGGRGAAPAGPGRHH